MKLLPKSLFGRITLILVGGLVAVQLITTALHVSERNALVVRIGAQQAAVRIGDMIRILEATSPGERANVRRAVPAETLRLTPGIADRTETAQVEASEMLDAGREALAQALGPAAE